MTYSKILALIPKEQLHPFLAYYKLKMYTVTEDVEVAITYQSFKYIFDN